MSFFIPLFVRKAILNLWGCKIEGTIHGHTTILSNKLSLGKQSFFNKNCFIGNGYDYVTIGSNCAIAYGVTITTDNHIVTDEHRRGGQIYHKPVVIKDGCWIGCNVTILPGSIIEEGCVIAAGSVVNGILQKNGLYAGIPAKLLKHLP